MTITYNNSFIYQKNQVAHGIKDITLNDNAQRIELSVAEVSRKMDSGEYGFTTILDKSEPLKSIHQVFQGCRWAKTLVAVGIGGSDLGGRAIQQALEIERAPLEVIFHGDSTDPVQTSRLLSQIDLDETIFCIISKSGETIEIISQYVLFKNFVMQQTADWADHFVFITDAKKGILREEADKYGVTTLVVPD